MKKADKKRFTKRRNNDEKLEIIYVQIGRIIPFQCKTKRSISEDGLMHLSDSIMRYGIIQPLIVRPTESGERKKRSEPMVYELISGERRWRAAKMAGIGEVPCISVDVNDRQAAELAIIENIGR